MSDCELIESCIFFDDTMGQLPTIADIYKRRYCRGDNSDCARHRVFAALGGESVPADLYPNEVDRAAALLAE